MLLLLLIGHVASVCADCHAYISDICHTRNTLIQGYRATDQLAIDRTNNILYTQLNYSLNIALPLNELNMSRVIESKRTSGMAIDQNTQDLYTSQFGVIYRYKYKNYYSIDRFTLGQHIADKLYYDDTLYLITPGGRFIYLNKTTQTADESHLRDYKLTDMVKVNSITFFIANNDVFKFDWDDETTQLVSENKQILSTDKYGNVYFVDSSQRVIYKRDNTTQKLTVHASFKSGTIKDFVFDKDNNIIFRDMDGVVAQWKAETSECVNSSPQNGCNMKEV